MAALHIAPQIGRPARPGPLTIASRNLITVCQTGGLARAKELLAAGIAFADVRDEAGCTTLFHACVNGHLDIAMLLLDHGCSIDALNDKMCSSLSATYFSTRAAGGFLNSDLLGEAYSNFLTDETGAASHVLDKIMAELLRRGANPNIPPGPGSALASAVRGKDLPMVKELLRRGADPNDGLGSEGAKTLRHSNAISRPKCPRCQILVFARTSTLSADGCFFLLIAFGSSPHPSFFSHFFFLLFLFLLVQARTRFC